MAKLRLMKWWELLAPASKILLILLAIPLLTLNVWVIGAIARYFHSLVVILVGAALLAFLLNYPVSFMEHHGAKRGRAAIIVFLLAITLLGALGITLFPLALGQAREFIHHLPQWMDSGKRQLNLLNSQFKDTGFPFSTDVLSGQINDRLQSQLRGLTGEAVNVAVITLTSLLDLLLTLVLAFYLLLHGEEIWNSLMEWLPASIRQPLSNVLRLSFQNFFLGQLIMASCLGCALTLVFLILQVPFGLLFGLTISFMALVPFGGTVGIILVTLLVALRDIGLGLKVLLASVLVQQILENLVGPRVLGKVTGLNPVWVLIAILSGARVGGLLGVVVAVPIAVVIKSALQSIRPGKRPISHNSHLLPWEPAMTLTNAPTPYSDPRVSAPQTLLPSRFRDCYLEHGQAAMQPTPSACNRRSSPSVYFFA